MFDIVNLPKSPRIARRLVEFAKIGGLLLSHDIYKLAEQELIHEEFFSTKNLQLTTNELNAVQFISDRRGRCVVLEDNLSSASRAIIGYTKIKNKFPIVIITNNLVKDRWIPLIKEFWPEATINLIVNTAAADPEQDKTTTLTITTLPQAGFDFYIMSPDKLYTGELLKKNRIAQMIVGYIGYNNSGPLIRRIVNNIEKASIETEGTIFVATNNISMPDNKNLLFNRKNDIPNTTDSEWQNMSLALQFARILHPTAAAFQNFISGEFSQLEDHLTENGITLKRYDWLPILNICPYLIS